MLPQNCRPGRSQWPGRWACDPAPHLEAPTTPGGCSLPPPQSLVSTSSWKGLLCAQLTQPGTQSSRHLAAATSHASLLPASALPHPHHTLAPRPPCLECPTPVAIWLDPSDTFPAGSDAGLYFPTPPAPHCTSSSLT